MAREAHRHSEIRLKRARERPVNVIASKISTQTRVFASVSSCSGKRAIEINAMEHCAMGEGPLILDLTNSPGKSLGDLASNEAKRTLCALGHIGVNGESYQRRASYSRSLKVKHLRRIACIQS